MVRPSNSKQSKGQIAKGKPINLQVKIKADNKTPTPTKSDYITIKPHDILLFEITDQRSWYMFSATYSVTKILNTIL